MAITLLQATLISINLFMSYVDMWGSSVIGWANPLFPCFVTGVILGDPVKGLIFGGTFTLFYMGVMPIGPAARLDKYMASVISTALAIDIGYTASEALIIALPFAILGQYYMIPERAVNTSLMHMADNAIEKYKFSRLPWIHLSGIFVWGLPPVLTTWGLLSFGTAAFLALYNALPVSLWAALGAAGQLMTSIGIATLVSMVYDVKYLPILLLGFGISAYMGIGLLGAAVIGLGIVALIVALQGGQES